MSLGACSLIYNPNNLPSASDAMPDTPAERFPCELAIDDVTPSVISEGTGTGGSRPALVVIRGKNIVKDGTTVTIEAPGFPRALSITVDNPSLDANISGELLAVPVSLGVDKMLGTQMVPLQVTVKQRACLEGPVEKVLDGKLSLKGLDELEDPLPPMQQVVTLNGGVREYSQIKVQTSTIAIAANQMEPVVLRSMSSVSITPAIAVNANGQTGGPAGGNGGNGGAPLGGVGTPGTGPSAGLPSGGPGRFDSTDLGLSTLSNPNRGSGGAGGDGSVLGAGGRGGGSGGSIEISAGGDLQVAAISARGAAGDDGAGAAAGGGGSGGVILLRAGGTLSAGNLDIRGGGTGHAGRARYDAAGTATVPAGMFGTDHYRGPMFVAPVLITQTATPELTLTGEPLSELRYFFVNDQGADVKGPFDATIAAGGTVRITLQDKLYHGRNQVCLVVKGASATSPTRNCIDVAYMQQ
jgi:hypothetical protein